MKKLVAVFSFLLLAGCMHTPQPASQQPTTTGTADRFEERHAEEMADKAALPGTGTATTELLYPEDPAPITTGWVNYGNGYTGYISSPEGVENAPAIILIHEWWGLNQHIIDMTKVLAANGYQALAVDLYNGQVAEDASQARELSSSVDQEQATQNLLAAEDFLRREQGANQVASLGWCFGGAQSLQLSLASETLDATLIYYGRLVTGSDTLANVNAPVLGTFAEEDGGIPPSSVAAFTSALASVNKEFDVKVYSGVGHAFANPTGSNHDPETTLQAWERTLEFLRTNLQ